MDDYSLMSLVESKNEWCSRLLTVLTPCVIEGLKSIFDEAYQLCKENEESDKYLMTFQNFLSRIPKWNSSIIEEEQIRIVQRSGCSYLEDLITCVHIVQLKALTCSRVGNNQKKVDINIPSLNTFIHKIYINVARKVYTNIYLFEIGISPLTIQKNNRELEIIIKEMILNTVRESIPIENILKAYLDETEEIDVKVEETQEIIPIKKEQETLEENVAENVAENNKEINIPNTSKPEIGKEIKLEIEKELEKSDINKSGLNNDSNNDLNNISIEIDKSNNNDNISSLDNQDIKFSNIDIAFDTTGSVEQVKAPKDIETLEEISKINNQKRKEEEEDDDEDSPLVIGDSIDLGKDIINDLSFDPKPKEEIILKDIEVL